MELHALDVQGLVTQAHDLVDGAVFVLRPGGDLEAVRQGLALDHQRVVTGHGHRHRQAGEHAFVLMENRAGLAVHHLASAHHVAAIGLADALVAQADAKDRQLAGEMQDGFDGHARFGRRARAGRNDDALGLERLDLGDGQLVIANDVDVGTQLAQVLHHVVGKGIVVVDHQQHFSFNPLIYCFSASCPGFHTPIPFHAMSGRENVCSGLEQGRENRPAWPEKGSGAPTPTGVGFDEAHQKGAAGVHEGGLAFILRHSSPAEPWRATGIATPGIMGERRPDDRAERSARRARGARDALATRANRRAGTLRFGLVAVSAR